MSKTKKVKENLYNINGGAELYLHIGDNNDVVGIDIKDTFDNLERDVHSFYKVYIHLKESYSFNTYIRDEQCEIESEAALSEHIKKYIRKIICFIKKAQNIIKEVS